MTHLFLSDVHLGAFTPEKNTRIENQLIELVDYCRQHQIQVHVIGDLFDYWMEYPGYVPPVGEKILDEFEKLNRIIRATYITGNHDFWNYGHFEEKGFLVEYEHHELNLDGSSVFLFHGDGLTEKKFRLPRPKLNHFLRNRKFISFFQWIFSAETGNHLMKNFSEFTRNEQDLRPERLNRWAKNFLANSSYHFVLTGHDHVPRIEKFPGGTYINCGAFYKEQTVVTYNINRFELVVWDSTKKQFKPFHHQPIQTVKE